MIAYAKTMNVHRLNAGVDANKCCRPTNVIWRWPNTELKSEIHEQGSNRINDCVQNTQSVKFSTVPFAINRKDDRNTEKEKKRKLIQFH